MNQPLARQIRTSSCYRCPFAHRQADSPTTFYCVLVAHVPDVTEAVSQRRRHAACLLLQVPFIRVVAGAYNPVRPRRSRLRSKKTLLCQRNRPATHDGL